MLAENLMIDASLIDQIYDAPMEAQPWSSFLTSYRRAMKSYGVQLMFSLPSESSAGVNIDLSEGADFEQTRDLYYNKYCTSNPVKYEQMQAGEVHSIFDFVDRRDFQRMNYYREFCLTHHVEYTVTLYLGAANGLHAWLNVSRDRAHGDYTGDELKFARELAPYLQRSLRMYSLLQKHKSAHSLYAQTVDSLGIATVFIDRQFGIISMNESARKMFAAGPCLAVVNGAVTMKNRDENKRFRHLFEDIRDKKAESSYITIAPCAHPEHRLRVMLKPIGHFPYGFSNPPAVVMHVKEPFEERHTDIEVIAKLFILSKSEARLVLMLATGSSVEQIASDLDISPNSARTYCKRIFAKTGTCRQTDLVRLVLDSVAILSP
jgi:DNA-binding CsgD family transcriptional regulator